MNTERSEVFVNYMKITDYMKITSQLAYTL
jgi:hypothetical protein